jgi:hypothetical protein
LLIIAKLAEPYQEEGELWLENQELERFVSGAVTGTAIVESRKGIR